MMKKNFKKATALAMASVMALGMTACGGGDDKGGNAADVKLTAPGTFPIVEEGEELTLTCFTMTMPNVEDFATNDYTKFVEEKTGVHIEWQTAGKEDWKEKLNMMLSSGEYPDMILGVSPDLAKFGAKEQIIIPLDDLITKENMPNYMERYGDRLDLSRESDGKIYSLLGENDCYHCSYGRKMWVNTKYLEEMGVEKPTTTQEFYDVCAKFKEYKPDGIPLIGTMPGGGWYSEFENFLMGSFILPPSTSYTLGVADKTAVNKDGKIVCVATDERYKAFLEYANSLYEAGFIYEGTFTQDSAQMKALINQPDAPVLFFPDGTISDEIDSVTAPELYAQYETLAPLEGPDGTRLTSFFKYMAVGGGNFCITDACKNPEAAIRWADFFYRPTADLESQFGPDEGKDWILDPPGEFGLDGEPADYKILNAYSGETQNHDWQDLGIRVAPAEYRLGAAVAQDVDIHSADGLEKLLFEETKNNYEPYGQNAENSDLDVLPELKMTSEESGNVSTIAVEITKIINEGSVSFITGKKDFEQGWDDFLNALDKAGLQTLLDTYQTAYDRQMK